MFRLTDALSLGLHAMKELGTEPRRRVNATRIAEKFGFSEAHLAKVMQALGRARLVDSVRGPAGGFTIARPPREIRLLSIVEAIEGPFNAEKCPFNLSKCGGKPCLLGRELIRLCRDLRGFLATTTLEDYVLGGGPKRRRGTGRAYSESRSRRRG